MVVHIDGGCGKILGTLVAAAVTFYAVSFAELTIIKRGKIFHEYSSLLVAYCICFVIAICRYARMLYW